jgi:hypothetical protein
MRPPPEQQNKMPSPTAAMHNAGMRDVWRLTHTCIQYTRTHEERDMTTQKVITESDFKALSVALNDAIEIDRLEKELAKRKDENRLKLLELGETLVDETTRTVAPGFQISQETVVEFDEQAALTYAKRDDVFAGAASMLTVRPDSIGVLIGLTLQFQNALALLATMPETDETAKLKSLFGSVNLKNIFTVDKAGYKAAVRDAVFADIPYTTKTPRLTVRITAKSVNLEKLADEFTVISDDELQPATAKAAAV